MSAPAPAALCITAVEAVTPLGFDAEQTCAAVRAGLNRFAEHPFHVCLAGDPEASEGEPLMASLLTELDPEVEGPERLLRLALPALKGIIAKAGLKRADLPKGGLLLSLPQADAGLEEKALAGFLPDLLRRSGLATLKTGKAIRQGHTGMAACFAEAHQQLVSGELEFALAAGAETYHMADRLSGLDETWRIKSARNADGFIPGEGAVVLLLELASRAAARKTKPLGMLSGITLGKETQNYASDLLSSGQGLGRALQSALTMAAPAPAQSGRWILCDMNGESYRAAEWGIVRTRMGDKLDPIAELTHPADCLGDTGAASAGLLVAYALHAFQRDYAPAREALIWNASDDGARSAFILKPHSAPPG